MFHEWFWFWFLMTYAAVTELPTALFNRVTHGPA